MQVSELLGVEAEVERLVGHLATYLEPRALAQQRGVIASPPSEQERGDALRVRLCRSARPALLLLTDMHAYLSCVAVLERSALSAFRWF